MKGPKVFLLVCEYFAGEVGAVIGAEEFDDVDMASFPAHCAKPTTWDSLKKIVPPQNEYASVHILISCCAAALGDSPHGLERCYVHKLAQCFHLIAGRNIVEACQKEGAYVLSPGWLAHWRDRMEQWGFDQKMAREFLGKSVAKLLLLDTGVDEKSSDRLAEFSGFVGLPFEKLPVGLDFIRLFLYKIVYSARLENEKAKRTRALEDKNRKLADYGMALDLLAKLNQVTTETEAIKNILNLFSMLFSPEKLVYLPVIAGNPGKVQVVSTDAVDIDKLQKRLSLFSENFAWTESGNGFILSIIHADATLGVIEIDGLAFPEYKESYVNLALFIVDVCGIAIDNARTYQQFKQAEKDAQYSKNFERLISEISSRLIGLKPEEIDQYISRALKKIAEFNGADSGYIFKFSEGGSAFSMTHLWTSNRLEIKKEELQGLDIAIMPWWINQLTNNQAVAVSSVANLPKEAGVEKGIIQNQGIGALVDVPMSFAGNIEGFLGIGVAAENRNWSKEEIGLLRLTGQLFTNALQRKRIEEEMKRNIEDLERFSRLSVGREKKMVNLKKEINNLKVKLGEEEKYAIIE